MARFGNAQIKLERKQGVTSVPVPVVLAIGYFVYVKKKIASNEINFYIEYHRDNFYAKKDIMTFIEQ